MAVTQDPEWLKATWSQCLNIIRKNFIGQEVVFDEFFDPTKLMAIDDTTATITTSSKTASKLLSTNSNYSDMIIQALKTVTQTSYAVKFIDEKSYQAFASPIQSKSVNRTFFTNSFLSKDFTFSNFVVGDSNMEAKQAAVLAVTSPGMMNPIFLYSSTGCGKTHLLNAIGNAFIERFGTKRVLYTNTEAFISEYVKIARGGSELNDFKQFFENIDMLLLDDIQFLKGRAETMNFFFNIFNNFVNAGKQIVITSDRMPSELEGLTDRLVSRFTSGLTILIKKPNPSTMLDILKVKIKGLNLNLDMFDPMVLDYLVSHNVGSVRSMYGDLNILLFTSSVKKNVGKITLDMCKEAFADRDTKTEDNKQITADRIIGKVCEFYSVTEAQIKSKVRILQIALARQIAMYLCRELMDMPYMEIGKIFGRDHSTVMSAIRKITKSQKTDPSLKRNLESMSRDLSSKVVNNS